MGNFLYNTGKYRLIQGATGAIAWLTDDITCIPFETDSDDDTDDEFVANVVSGGGVVVTSTGMTFTYGGNGRISITSPAIAVDQTNDRAEFDCADVVWTSISQNGSETWVAFVFAKDITSDALSPVVCHIDTATGIPLTPNGSDITLTIDGEGLMHIT